MNPFCYLIIFIRVQLENQKYLNINIFQSFLVSKSIALLELPRKQH